MDVSDEYFCESCHVPGRWKDEAEREGEMKMGKKRERARARERERKRKRTERWDQGEMDVSTEGLHESCHVPGQQKNETEREEMKIGNKMKRGEEMKMKRIGR
jgi:hypothetical protein